jgi:alanine racemase
MRGTRLELRSEALRHNARRARDLCGDAELYAMIKADGYGHGLIFAARAMAPVVDGFGVALMEEARQLRAAGIDAPLMLLEGVFDAEELQHAARLGCQVVIHSLWQLDLLQCCTDARPLTIWLKLDTGMHRLGLPEQTLADVLHSLQALTGVQVAGVMSHFSCADMTPDPFSDSQLARLRQQASRHGLPFSAANSAALFRYPASVGGRVRPGIMLYGSSPFSDRSASDLGLAVTQRLSARIIALNAVPAGDTVGYGASWCAPQDSLIAVVAIGYGDGYPRHAPSGTPVAVQNADGHWRRAPLAGRVSMDMITVDVTGLSVQVGDSVELWGDQVSVDEVARHCGTISYELFCRLTARPLRIEC